VHAELAVVGRQLRRGEAVHVLLRLHPVLDDVGDGDDLQAVADGELPNSGEKSEIRNQPFSKLADF
jgi:hypothetical protein